MLDQSAPTDLLLARSLAYRFLATLYLAEPDPAWIAGLAREGLLDDFPVPASDGSVQDGLALIRASGRRLLSDDAEAEAIAIRRDYLALFLGPGHVPAPPWESVYRSREHLLFDWPTLEVREAYQTMGLRNPRPQEADDHIGLELLFLALLDEYAARGDRTAPPARLHFLDQHVRCWVSAFCQDVLLAASTDFWRGVALLTEGLLSQEHQTH